MKIGVIYCAWQTEDMVNASLHPWIVARETQLGGHDYVICAVSVPFEGFPQTEQLDNTLHLLRLQHAPRQIDHLISGDKPMKETEARGQALRWLVDQGVDLIWQWDSDEIPATEEIGRVLQFVESRPQIAWFRGSLKNYVFDKQTYLVQPFTPPRIHRVDLGGYRARGFWDDNNVSYYGKITRDIRQDVSFPSVAIPKNIQFTPHYTWLSDLRSKKKVEYQMHRWGNSSFDWDDSRGGLIWRAGQPIPETTRD